MIIKVKAREKNQNYQSEIVNTGEYEMAYDRNMMKPRNDSFGKNQDQPQTEDQIKHNICNQESAIESAGNNDPSSPDKHTQKGVELNCVICQTKFKSKIT